MFDLGLGSLEAFTLKDLVRLLLVMVACIAAIIFIGFDGIVVAIVIRYTFPVFVELARRAWGRIKSRLCAPT
jgi:hypothetical protein